MRYVDEDGIVKFEALVPFPEDSRVMQGMKPVSFGMHATQLLHPVGQLSKVQLIHPLLLHIDASGSTARTISNSPCLTCLAKIGSWWMNSSTIMAGSLLLKSPNKITLSSSTKMLWRKTIFPYVLLFGGFRSQLYVRSSLRVSGSLTASMLVRYVPTGAVILYTI